MHPRSLIGLALVVCNIGLFFAGIIARNESPELVIRETINPCYFTPPGPRIIPPYPRGVKYCLHGNTKSNMIDLMQHMRSRATGEDDALTAPQFGSAVRLVYLPKEGTFLINPELDDTGDSHMITCVDDHEGYLVERQRPNKVRATFINEHFHQQTKVFGGGSACLLQSINEVL